MKNHSAFQGYSTFIIMVFVSVVLLAFSFWTISRRTNSLSSMSQYVPTEQNQEPEKPQYEWTDYNSSSAGVAFKYPKNVFTGKETKATEAGNVSRIFLGTGNNGTLTVSTVKRQFNPGQLLDLSGKPQKASAINVGGRIGYQYQTQTSSCTNKAVQFANGAQTVVFAFSGCESDEEPLVSADQDLFLQVLASVKLTPQEPQPEQEGAENFGQGIDTLPPELQTELKSSN